MSERCAYILQSIDALTSLVQSIPSCNKPNISIKHSQSKSHKNQHKKRQKSKPQRNSNISRIIFLGTASAQPMPLKRNVSSLVIETTKGNLWMVDCGEATLHQLQVSTLKISKLRNIFITHLHGDHCYGLFGLFNTIRILHLNHIQ
eukprot:475975_1